MLLLFHFPAHAQTTFGSITGSVIDPSNAAVPNAHVTVTNQATGSKQSVDANGVGVFNVPDVQPGTYNVQVEAGGFQTQHRNGIVVYAHNTVNVNIPLALGGTTTAVSVSAAPPVLDTASPTLSYTQTSAQLLQAPTTTSLQDTNQYFALYSPGVNINNGGGIHSNGVRTADTRVANDGIIEMADPDGVGGGPIGPSPQSISEVTTVTTGASAEYQEPTNVVVVTKSGSNEFHGYAMWSWNGSDLNARNFFSSTVPFNNFNDINGNLGGPIKKNKLFFYMNYEALRSRGQSVLNANVPLAPWRSGDFGSLPQTLVNPFTGQPFPGNQIPASLISPVAQKAMNFFYPAPNFGPPGLQSGNWRSLLPSTSNSDTGDGRIDYNISARDRVFGRFTYHANNSESVNGGSLPAALYDVNRPTNYRRSGSPRQACGSRRRSADWTYRIPTRSEDGRTRSRVYRCIRQIGGWGSGSIRRPSGFRAVPRRRRRAPIRLMPAVLAMRRIINCRGPTSTTWTWRCSRISISARKGWCSSKRCSATR